MKKIFILICALFVVANVSAQPRKVGDILMVDEEIGVIIAVSTDGRHGKVMSVSETQCNWNDAKKWCANLGLGGYWTLPTIEELILIYRQKSVINSALSANGYATLTDWGYWSSDWKDTDFAYGLYMPQGFYIPCEKSSNNSVRAVCTF